MRGALETFPFRRDRFVLVVARDHPLAKRARIGFEEVLEHDFVGLDRASALQRFLAAKAVRIGRPLRLRVQLRSFDAVCRLVECKVGIGIVPETTARRVAKTMAIAAVPLTDPWAVRESDHLHPQHEGAAALRAATGRAFARAWLEEGLRRILGAAGPIHCSANATRGDKERGRNLTSADCFAANKAASCGFGRVWPRRYSRWRRCLLCRAGDLTVQRRVPAMMALVVSEGRLLWLKPSEWSLLLISAAFCGMLTLIF